MLFGGNQRDGFDIGRETLVRQRHAELELEIRKDAQSTHDDLRANLAGEFHGET